MPLASPQRLSLSLAYRASTISHTERPWFLCIKSTHDVTLLLATVCHVLCTPVDHIHRNQRSDLTIFVIARISHPSRPRNRPRSATPHTYIDSCLAQAVSYQPSHTTTSVCTRPVRNADPFFSFWFVLQVVAQLGLTGDSAESAFSLRDDASTGTDDTTLKLGVGQALITLALILLVVGLAMGAVWYKHRQQNAGTPFSFSMPSFTRRSRTGGSGAVGGSGGNSERLLAGGDDSSLLRNRPGGHSLA